MSSGAFEKNASAIDAAIPSGTGCIFEDSNVVSEDMVTAVFREWDAHGVGKIPQQELANIIQVLLPDISPAALNDLFAISDIDQDGCLNYEEFVSFIFGLGPGRSIDSHRVPDAADLALDENITVAAACEKTAACENATLAPLSDDLLPVLTKCKEASCPGTLLVSDGLPLGDRITMLGGMLAHPCVGIYPYRDGPAPTIVAAQISSGDGGTVPSPMKRALARAGVEKAFDVFFIVSDVSKGGFARATAFNIVHHPWCFPKVMPGQTIGTGAGWLIGLHVPAGGGVVPEGGMTASRTGVSVRATASARHATPEGGTTSSRAGASSRISATTRPRDADPRGAAMESMERTSVFVHPGFGGALCCSPNNVRVGLRRPAPVPVATLWAACVREAGAAKSRRACVCVHWLVADADVATRLTAAATDANTLQEFLATASLELGPELPPMVAISTACQRLGA